MSVKRPVLLTIFLTLLVFSAVTYTACTKKNKCLNVVCAHGGSCDGGHCQCLVGYEGTRCELLMRDKFVNTYNGHDSCGNFNGHTYDQYPIRLFAVRTDSTELTMKNILNNVDDSAIATMITTDSFNFTGVNNSTTYYGYGKLHNDTLVLNYHVQHDTSSYNCHYFGIGLH